VLVEVDGEPPLILDLGTGLRALGDHLEPSLKAAGTPLRANALLSHLHYDHVLGLPFFSPMRDPGARLDVHGPSQEGGQLQDVLGGMVKPPFFPVQMADFRGELCFHDLDGPADFSLGSIRVKARSIPHLGHTLGFRLEAEGRTVSYISDHQAPVDRMTVDKEVLDLCDDADLLIHDGQYSDEEFVQLSDWGHSTPAYAVLVARESGARRLSLFHHDPSHTDKDIDRLLSHARRLSSKPRGLDIGAASEGTSIDLGSA
jgi:phosphoribosyl 1,2-cyclic phosphodiesterase